MAVRLRMKRLGRRHRPFFRICAMDSRSPRDGRVIEELGHYDPMVRDTDARVVLNRERVDYWLGTGAKPTAKVAVLIRKYGTGGTKTSENEEALKNLQQERQRRGPPEGFKPPPVKAPSKEEETAEAPAEGEAPAVEESAEEKPEAAQAEAPAAEAATEEASAEAPAEEAKPEEEKKEE